MQDSKSSIERHWYVAYTRPRQEKSTQKEIADMGIEAYVPLRKTIKKWSDRKKMVEEPLLRSYIFIHANESERVRAIEAQGAVRYIFFSGQPAIARDRDIQFLKRLLQEEADFDVQTDHIPKGTEVEVVAGLFIGHRGELVDYLNRSRVVLRFEQAGFALTTNIAVQDVRPVGIE